MSQRDALVAETIATLRAQHRSCGPDRRCPGMAVHLLLDEIFRLEQEVLSRRPALERLEDPTQ